MTGLRIAWMGPAPSLAEGVSFAATQLLRGLARTGAEVDCFVAAEADGVPEGLREEPGLRFFTSPARWSAHRWYSREPLSRFVSSQIARARAQSHLADLIAQRHAERPYDVLYQFSQIELGRLRRLRAELPPIVLHPEVHAAGELRWVRREKAIARRCEPLPRRLAVGAMLGTRARIQSSDLRSADMVIAPSRRFAGHLANDCGVEQGRLRVVANPIDVERFAPGPEAREGPVRLLFVSRISVRKGVEMVVRLSHALDDLHGRVSIELAGDRTLWSDYRCLLDDLNPATARYLGAVSPTDVAGLYRTADGMIHPAHYEPFALTVGEALACGLPVVVSDEAGAGEGVDERCCSVFPAGDDAAFEAAVRRLVDDVERGRGHELGRIARSEATRLFAPEVVADRLRESLEGVSGGPCAENPSGRIGVLPTTPT